MLAQEFVNVGETLGEMLWRVAQERVLNEEHTDEIAQSVGELLAEKMPLKWLPWASITVPVMDRFLPEYGLLALRQILGIVGLIDPDDPKFAIPSIDGEIFSVTEGNG